MPKEIANKAKKEIHPHTKGIFGVGVYIKCKKCVDEISGDTRKKMTYCKCRTIAVDGCDDYIRAIGNEGDCETIKK